MGLGQGGRVAGPPGGDPAETEAMRSNRQWMVAVALVCAGTITQAGVVTTTTPFTGTTTDLAAVGNQNLPYRPGIDSCPFHAHSPDCWHRGRAWGAFGFFWDTLDVFWKVWVA